MDTTILLITALICYVCYVILKVRNNGKRKRQSTSKTKQKNYQSRQVNPDEHYHPWPSSGEFEFEVVGESFYQENIAQLSAHYATDRDTGEFRDIKTVTAHLIPDDGNPYDNKAVRIDIDGKTIGHLSKENARSFRRRLSAKKLTNQITTCDAIITGGHIKDGKQYSYGVALDIQPFE